MRDATADGLYAGFLALLYIGKSGQTHGRLEERCHKNRRRKDLTKNCAHAASERTREDPDSSRESSEESGSSQVRSDPAFARSEKSSKRCRCDRSQNNRSSRA